MLIRKCLAVVALLLVVCGAEARFPRGTIPASGGIDANFSGSPLAVISTINTSGGIITSRDADLAGCKEPCFIHVSSKAITSPQTTKPYMDLSCSWNFGDPSGAETFTRPTDGVTVNANTDQTGCDAAYVYRVGGGGPYTITLTLKGSNGNCDSAGRCAVVTAIVTKNITVTTFAASGGELWYDSNFVCSPTCLGTLAAPYNSASDFPAGNTLLNSGNNVAVNVKRGSDFTVVQGWEIFPGADRSGIRIRAYGAGADPIIRTNGASTRVCLSLGGGNGSPTINVADIVVTGIKCIGATTGIGAISIGNRRNGVAAGGAGNNIYLDNVTAQVTASTSAIPLSTAGTGGGQTTPLIEEGFRWGCWKCVVSSPLGATSAGIGKVGSAALWDFFVGGFFEGAGTDRTFDHHYYPDTRENFLVQWVSFNATGTGANTRSFGINGNWDGVFGEYDDHQIAQYYAINENFFLGTANGGTDHTIDLGNRTNNTPTSSLTASISGTTMTVTSFAPGANLALTAGPAGVGNSLISTFSGGTLVNGTRIVGSSSVSPGSCTPNCTGAGSTGTYAVDTSQTVASQAMYTADSTVFFDNVVISGNAEAGFANGSMIWGDGRSVTIRDGRVWGGTGEWFRPAVDQFPGWTMYQNAVNNIYRMKIYMGAGTNSCIMCFNIGKTWTTPQYIAYNTIVDARTTPQFDDFVWADFVTSGAVWNFNIWSAPNGSNPWYNNGASTTFAIWQLAATSPPRWGANDNNLGASTPPGWTIPPTQWSHMN